MKEIDITRPYLESLATDELVRMADLLGFDIPPGLDRIFIIEELLESTSEEFMEDDEEENPLKAEFIDTGFFEAVALPRQYNITFLEIIIRDPLWAFVFWELKGSDKNIFEKAADFNGYYLKVSPQNGDKEGVFIVPVGIDDTAWYLGFPAGDSPEGEARSYIVELCADRGGEVSLASSPAFALPGLPGRLCAGGDALRRLSGAEDFRILRSGDRLSRVKKPKASSAG
ncbi:DUF4912 domain-containing protein [Leadbettera azotonutricia]|uniref:DUF4912 domain-containing protein n=1 Tax=Leadbettera azotonutricia (strain ATCC BAA-888 / DSM 13862 / ZAS-9) TaxID=545695 RepID=F5Y9J0_LEAAZ|nr:DUF4912 domain-containing protein [Leadbettera azotonutricia]AEF80376.1 conserved hypothetical protein [Leadbettera azotonutricia ZAS-9]